MTDSQKVFIFGVDGRGAEVIKTLTDLGGKNCDDLNGENSNVVLPFLVWRNNGKNEAARPNIFL